MYEFLLYRWAIGALSIEQIRSLVLKKRITQSQADEILATEI